MQGLEDDISQLLEKVRELSIHDPDLVARLVQNEQVLAQQNQTSQTGQFKFRPKRIITLAFLLNNLQRT